MVVRRIGPRIPPISRLWLWPAGFCILAGLIALAAVSAGWRQVHAQTGTPAPAANGQSGAASDQNQDSTAEHPQSGAASDENQNSTAENPPSAAASDENQNSTAENPTSVAASPVAEAQPKPSGSDSPEQRRKQEVANECANLLKMAKDLKAEVDKTTKDELSINVVRKAGEVEQLARKVRGDTRLTAGRD